MQMKTFEDFEDDLSLFYIDIEAYIVDLGFIHLHRNII